MENGNDTRLLLLLNKELCVFSVCSLCVLCATLAIFVCTEKKFSISTAEHRIGTFEEL